MPMTSFGGLWTIFAALSVSGRTEHSKTGKNQHITCSRLFKAKVICTKYGSLCPKSITPYFKKVWERDRLDLNIPALIRVNILFSQQGNGLYYTLSPLHTLQQKQSTKASFFSLPLERNIVGRVCVFVYAAGGPRERIKKALLHTHTTNKLVKRSIRLPSTFSSADVGISNPDECIDTYISIYTPAAVSMNSMVEIEACMHALWFLFPTSAQATFPSFRLEKPPCSYMTSEGRKIAVPFEKFIWLGSLESSWSNA